LRPIPGATPNGSRAYSPIKIDMVLHTSTVAVRAPENVMPVPGVDRIVGLTITMYDIVKNVVTPPTISR
jgi:hypothetical protein